MRVRVRDFLGTIPLKSDNKLTLYSIKVVGEPQVIIFKKEKKTSCILQRPPSLREECVLLLQYGFPTVCQRFLLCKAEGIEHDIHFSDSHELSRGKNKSSEC